MDLTNFSDLTLRQFHGESDFPAMASVLVASEKADKIERQVTPQELAAAYQQLTNCDPYQDLVLAEIAGEVVGYMRGAWREEPSAGRLYILSGFLAPACRNKGIGRALLLWGEERMRQVAALHPAKQAKYFQVEVSEHQSGKASLLEHAGYQAVRYFYEMVRPSLEEIPQWSLPLGVELRTVLPEHYPAIWTSVDETSRDEWGYTQATEESYRAWLVHPHFQPHLWQVAWDPLTERVVGHVLTFIDESENENFNRKRGYTEGIGVDRTWRRRGLARALIATSLHAQKTAGMSESALFADSESESGATRLYESCGFQVIGRSAIYRKAL